MFLPFRSSHDYVYCLNICIFSEIVDSLQVIRPDRVSHQIYLEACETYKYPSRPQVSSDNMSSTVIGTSTRAFTEAVWYFAYTI